MVTEDLAVSSVNLGGCKELKLDEAQRKVKVEETLAVHTEQLAVSSVDQDEYEKLKLEEVQRKVEVEETLAVHTVVTEQLAVSSVDQGGCEELKLGEVEEMLAVRTVVTEQLAVSSVNQEEMDSKWRKTDPSTLTAEQERFLFSKMIEVAVLTVFRNHMYQFGGLSYRQLKGAPIGLRLTSIVTRIVMDQWMARFLTKLDMAGVEVHLIAKYVDDINLILSNLRLGSRWRQDRVVQDKVWEEEDTAANKSQDEVTMECARDAACSVLVWLDFTLDIPQYHDSKMVPILDLQVWIHHPSIEDREEGLTSDVVMWQFYEKKTVSKSVLRAESAYTWRAKLTTLGMETFRRMRNTSRQVNLGTRSLIMKRYVDKIRRSGYSQGTCRGVILSGLKFYYRKTRIDLQGGPKVNERRETDTIMRKRAKLGASQNWFARRRGGATEKSRKDLGWMSQDPDQQPARRLGGPWGPRVARGDHRSSGTQPGQSTVQPTLGKEQKVEKDVVSTLLVPYTMGRGPEEVSAAGRRRLL